MLALQRMPFVAVEWLCRRLHFCLCTVKLFCTRQRGWILEVGNGGRADFAFRLTPMPFQPYRAPVSLIRAKCYAVNQVYWVIHITFLRPA